MRGRGVSRERPRVHPPRPTHLTMILECEDLADISLFADREIRTAVNETVRRVCVSLVLCGWLISYKKHPCHARPERNSHARAHLRATLLSLS